jgi:hypothetical protein
LPLEPQDRSAVPMPTVFTVALVCFFSGDNSTLIDACRHQLGGL